MVAKFTTSERTARKPEGLERLVFVDKPANGEDKHKDSPGVKRHKRDMMKAYKRQGH